MKMRFQKATLNLTLTALVLFSGAHKVHGKRTALITSYHKSGWHASRILVNAIQSTSPETSLWGLPLYKQSRRKRGYFLANVNTTAGESAPNTGFATGFGGRGFERCALCGPNILVGACDEPVVEDCRSCCEGRARVVWGKRSHQVTS